MCFSFRRIWPDVKSLFVLSVLILHCCQFWQNQIIPDDVMIDFWPRFRFSWLVSKHSWCNGQYFVLYIFLRFAHFRILYFAFVCILYFSLFPPDWWANRCDKQTGGSSCWCGQTDSQSEAEKAADCLTNITNVLFLTNITNVPFLTNITNVPFITKITNVPFSFPFMPKLCPHLIFWSIAV